MSGSQETKQVNQTCHSKSKGGHKIESNYSQVSGRFILACLYFSQFP